MYGAGVESLTRADEFFVGDTADQLAAPQQPQ
jgi:hypothetical protein